MDGDFAGHGFVYWEESLSPDGRVRVLWGYSDGEKTPLLEEPRFVDAATGEVILDLWHTSHTYLIKFGREGEVILTAQNPFRGTSRVAVIDYERRTFTLDGGAETEKPLAVLREKLKPH